MCFYFFSFCFSGKKLEEVVTHLEELIIHGDPESQDLPK